MESFYGIPIDLGLRQNGFTDMLQDEDRNSKYFEALKSAINDRHKNGQKAEVLDIGTGAGLLALMAAKAGADKVWACEMNKSLARCAEQVIRKNHYADKIIVIDKISTDLRVGRGKDLPRRANILVTEIFATSLLFEDAINTFNHANDHLLTDDCIMIPKKAILYAQVVECRHFEEFSFIRPILLPSGDSVTFPQNMLTCSDATSADVDQVLSSLNTNRFKKLSNTLAVFEFSWRNKQVEKDRANIEFISNRSGTANAIFTWWDLEMDNSEENVISLRPTWAGGAGLWRFHWNQTVHFGQTSVQLQEGTQCVLEAFHDDVGFWFRLSMGSGANCSRREIPTKGQCKCLVHCLLNSYQTGLLNDERRNSMYVEAITDVIKPGKSVCLNLSEPKGSILHLIAGKLSAKKVFVIATAEKGDDPSCFEAVQIITHRQNRLRNVTHVQTPTGHITSSDLDNMTVDVVIGDPYFGGLGEPSSYNQQLMRLHLPRILEYKPEGYPWHQLLFGYYLDSLRQKGLIASDAKILPFKAVLRGVAIQFENLHKINRPITKVFQDMFDFSDYMQIIQKQAVNGGRLDHQYLWQYPGTASSSAFDIMTFDFTNQLKSQNSIGHVKLDHVSNGVGLWMEWHLTKNSVSHTGGPTSEIKSGEAIEWDMHSEQGVYYIWESFVDEIKYNVNFIAEEVNLKFDFSGLAI